MCFVGYWEQRHLTEEGNRNHSRHSKVYKDGVIWLHTSVKTNAFNGHFVPLAIFVMVWCFFLFCFVVISSCFTFHFTLPFLSLFSPHSWLVHLCLTCPPVLCSCSWISVWLPEFGPPAFAFIDFTVLFFYACNLYFMFLCSDDHLSLKLTVVYTSACLWVCFWVSFCLTNSFDLFGYIS